MKTKTDFTTNSSSASFVISLADITAKQLKAICNHALVAGGDAWKIKVTDTMLTGDTFMDNFDMYSYLEDEAGVDMTKVTWEGDN
jgi:predicted lactoylglutathione lyase